MTRLKFVANVVAGQSPPSADVSELLHGRPFLQGNAEFGQLSPAPKWEAKNSPKVADTGDILISVRAPVGSLNVADQSYGIGRGLAAVQTFSADRSFVWWWLHTQVALLDSESTGSTFKAINSRTLEDLKFPDIGLLEQRAIADYLDRETQKIDELIAEQCGLIETLKRRRRATIEKSVFGLDNEVARAPRIEPWLPDLPESWRAMQLGFVAESQAGYAFPSEGFQREGLGTRLLRGINVKPDAVDWSDQVTWDEQAKPIPPEFSLETGDIVFGMDRPFVGGGIRVTAMREEDLPALLVQRVLRLRASGEMQNGYLQYVLRTPALKHYLEPMFTGVSVPHISEWQVRKFVLPVPPLNEQSEIVAYLDDQTARIDELISESEDLITLSRERRAALITAAVTGQIDVREAI